ncbi:ABC-three component system middle component 6 [Nautilia sp.]
MGNKIFNLEDTLFVIGAEIIEIIRNKNLKIDKLHKELNKRYVKEISFDKMMYALDFLFILDKVEIKEKDIIGLK